MQESQSISILIVDDNDIDIRMLRRAFTKQRISNPVYAANDGEEALELLRGEGGAEKIPRPYIILLDLNMPRMDGFQFLHELRNDPELSISIVFVLTSSNNDRDKMDAYSKHVAGYLVKATTGDEFLSVVRLLEHFLLTNQFPPEVK